MMPPDRLPPTVDGNGWNEWSRFVLAELKRHSRLLEDLRKESVECHAQMRADIAALKIKAGAVGLAGGMVPAVILMIYFLMSQ